MTPRDLLRRTSVAFRDAGIPDPETDSALLLSSLCGRSSLELRLDMETVLSDRILRDYAKLVQRRLSREPLQYILGEVSFCGLFFQVDSRVLIPRPETELLCEWALELLKPLTSPRILDLCCGSGCIGLSLAHALPNAEITLSDCSADALAVTRENAARLGLHVILNQGDLLDGLPDDAFDMIISNPPYIPSADCAALQEEVLREPRLALDGGSDGLSFYRRIAVGASRVLKPGAFLLMELGIGEADAVSGFLSAAGFSSIAVREDLNHIARMILAVYQPLEALCLKS